MFVPAFGQPENGVVLISKPFKSKRFLLADLWLGDKPSPIIWYNMILLT